MHRRVTVVSLCVCVSVSVTTLSVASFISTLKLRYEQLYYGILLIFDSWTFIKLLRSDVMALFAYHVSHVGTIAATFRSFLRRQGL